MVNLQNTGVVTGSTSNPPLATPLNVAGAVRLESAQATATGLRSRAGDHGPELQPGRMQTWNVNVEREFGPIGLMVGYFGSYGDRLSVPVNINQFVNGGAAVPEAVGDEPDPAERAARQHHRTVQSIG